MNPQSSPMLNPTESAAPKSISPISTAQDLVTDRCNLTNLESYLDLLEQSFEQVSTIADTTEREVAITQESNRLGLTTASYRHRFESYITAHNISTSETVSLMKSVSILDTKLGDFVGWLEHISIVKLATVLGESALLIALLSYLLTVPQRHQQTVFEARQIIADQVNLEHSQSRTEALRTLNEMCAGIPGLHAEGAHMDGIELNHCYQFQFNLQSLSQWPPQFLQFKGMDLAHAHLPNATLQGANLAGANLTGADFQRADLAGANLAGADLTGANLTGANLTDANLDGTILNKAILKQSVLNGASLKTADLSRADLSEVKALWADFEGAKLYRTDLRQANLNRANLAATDLYKAQLQQSKLRFVNLQDNATLRESNLMGAELTGATFWSVDQVKRADYWESATKNANWAKKVALHRPPRLRIGLIKSTEGSIFRAYELGMRRAANRRVEIWGIQTQPSVKAEAKAIQELIEFGIDAIVLVPQDPIGSKAAIQAAYEAGVVVITVDFCFDEPAAKRFVFACYNTNSFRMGYDSGQYLAKWAAIHLKDQEINVGLVDSAAFDRYYPNLQGFLAAMNQAAPGWNEVASTDAILTTEVDKVVQLLQQHPDINVLWGGSNTATEIALAAVQRLGIPDQVAVFGILDLSQDKAQMLLDPKSPLQSIIDQAGVEIGYEAVKTAIAVLKHNRKGYEFHPVQHRLLTQADQDTVRKLLGEANSIR